jgi:hypothetical protein
MMLGDAVRGTDLVPVLFHWSNRHGDCYQCGCPAHFYTPDAYGNDQPITDKHKRCAICAADDAVDGERVTRIDPDVFL